MRSTSTINHHLLFYILAAKFGVSAVYNVAFTGDTETALCALNAQSLSLQRCCFQQYKRQFSFSLLLFSPVLILRYLHQHFSAYAPW